MPLKVKIYYLKCSSISFLLTTNNRTTFVYLLHVAGNPSPNITWYRDNNVPQRKLGAVHYRQWSITLEDVIPSDSGNYTCVVCNVYGCINYTFKVIIQGKNCMCMGIAYVH